MQLRTFYNIHLGYVSRLCLLNVTLFYHFVQIWPTTAIGIPHEIHNIQCIRKIVRENWTMCVIKFIHSIDIVWLFKVSFIILFSIFCVSGWLQWKEKKNVNSNQMIIKTLLGSETMLLIAKRCFIRCRERQKNGS